MAKPDPKDERIAELELQLEAANKATSTAEEKAQLLEALRGQIQKLEGELASGAKKVKDLEAEVEMFKAAAGAKSKPTVAGLDPAKAVQLKVSSMVVSSTSKEAIVAVAGDVLALTDAFDEVSRKVGTLAKVHAVPKDEIEAAKRSGRAY